MMQDLYSNALHRDCIFSEEDELRKAIRGDNVVAKIRRFFKRMVLPCVKYAGVINLFKSDATLRHEMKRQIYFHPYIIHPFSQFRQYWEVFMVIALLVSTAATPLFSAYLWQLIVIDGDVNYLAVCLSVDILNAIDFALSFHTGIFVRKLGSIELSKKKVAKMYCTSPIFIVEILTIFPYEYVNWWRATQGHYITSAHLMFYFKALRIIKINKYLLNISVRMNFPSRLQEAGSMVLLYYVFLHWCSCSFQILHMWIRDTATSTWIYANNLETSPIGNRYIQALFITIIMFVSSGYGSKSATVGDEMILFTVITTFGHLMSIFLFCKVYVIYTSSPEFSYSKSEQQLKSFMYNRRLPPAAQMHLLEFYKCSLELIVSREDKIYSVLSRPLLSELIKHIALELSPLYYGMVPEPLLFTTMCLSRQLFLEGETIIQPDDIANVLYFVSTGTIAIYSPIGKELYHALDGSFFGEVAVILDDTLMGIYAIAVETSVVYRMSKQIFKHILRYYPKTESLLLNTAHRKRDAMYTKEDEARMKTETEKATDILEKPTRPDNVRNGKHSLLQTPRAMTDKDVLMSELESLRTLNLTIDLDDGQPLSRELLRHRGDIGFLIKPKVLKYFHNLFSKEKLPHL